MVPEYVDNVGSFFVRKPLFEVQKLSETYSSGVDFLTGGMI